MACLYRLPGGSEPPASHLSTKEAKSSPVTQTDSGLSTAAGKPIYRFHAPGKHLIWHDESGDVCAVSADGARVAFAVVESFDSSTGNWYVLDHQSGVCDQAAPYAGNKNLMWGANGHNYFWGDTNDLVFVQDGTEQSRSSLPTALTYPLSEGPGMTAVSWTSGTCACEATQYVRGYAEINGTAYHYVQPFDAVNGTLLPGWWLRDVSPYERFHDLDCGLAGFIIHPVGSEQHLAHWVNVDGTGWMQLEQPTDTLDPAFHHSFTQTLAAYGTSAGAKDGFTTVDSYTAADQPPSTLCEKSPLEIANASNLAGQTNWVGWVHGFATNSNVYFSAANGADPSQEQGIMSLNLATCDLEPIVPLDLAWAKPDLGSADVSFRAAMRPTVGGGKVWWHGSFSGTHVELFCAEL